MKTSTPLRTIAALALAASAGWAGAGTVSLSMDRTAPLTVGETVTFTVGDSRPRDMFDGAMGVAAADFSLHYDTAALQFVAVDYPSWISAAASLFVLDNGASPPDGEVLVTLSGLDETALPDGPDEVFRVSFVVRPTSAGSVSVAPTEAQQPSYSFTAPDPLRFEITGAVPLPSTLTLLAAGLLAAGLGGLRARPVR